MSITADGLRDDEWRFPTEVQRSLDKNGNFEIVKKEHYPSGRPRLEAVFYSADRKKILGVLQAMEVFSRNTGRSYHVCREYIIPSEFTQEKLIDYDLL